MSLWRTLRLSIGSVALAGAMPVAAAQPLPVPDPTMPAGPPFSATYADLADLADLAPLVARVQVRSLARVEPARAGNVAPGHGRFYIEARTRALLAGPAPLGSDIAFLADLPIDARSRPPALKGREVLVFARIVSGQPGQVALVAPDALLAADPALQERLRGILTALMAPDRPAKVTGVREIIHVPGNLVGEGETQAFLVTADGSAASLTIDHHPGQPPQWGASFSELTADLGHPPRPDTLAWYRLACFLPAQLPEGVDRSDGAAAQAQAAQDYRFVLDALGSCPRERR